MFPKFLILLFSFLLFGSSLARVVPAQNQHQEESGRGFILPRDDKGPAIEVFRDESVRPSEEVRKTAKAMDTWMWSALAKFDHEVTDEQMVQISEDAYASMVDRWEKEDIKGYGKPKVMTALRKGNEVYIASSAKGKNFIVYQKPDKKENGIHEHVPKSLAAALTACWNNAEGDKEHHTNDANCGEIMTAWAYFVEKSDGDNSEDVSLKGAKTVTWELALHKYKKDGQDVEERVGQIKPPCGNDNDGKWGCHSVVQELGIEAIPQETKGKPYDPPKELYQRELFGACKLKKQSN
ncbi:hypothetical protein P168DRAFT_330654 [Aspergillus campestris IBT 28561]|uniref:Uncharacterized protein n=1 Tax=Aspergillus campestris (strain IBT 28561) TaxID=1392248 RepID=A0A2I1CR66_ASPC2|nr:uncharacterized protein P168DRAFT_330654 [Aspergillus campestris IBT 28561]PKY00113.1 hypothetical protein P168DRAFT_330654 [Aspergillus campestris IBT 28561]